MGKVFVVYCVNDRAFWQVTPCAKACASVNVHSSFSCTMLSFDLESHRAKRWCTTGATLDWLTSPGRDCRERSSF